MSPGHRLFRVISWFFLSAGLALFLLLLTKLPQLSAESHPFPFSFFLFIILFGLAFFFFLALFVFASRIFSFLGPGSDRDKTLLTIFFPWALFSLSPFLLRFYWSRHDLFLRLLLLAIIIVFSFLIIGLVSYEKYTTKLSQWARGWINRISLWPEKKKLLTLFSSAFLGYQAVALLLVLQGITFSGDEPNYLLTTHSLVYDGDINLANNYARQDYFSFYSREENPRLKLGIYGRYGRKGRDYIYPINLPGISVLMIPFYVLSQLFTGKLLTFILKGSLAVWAALFGVQVYLFVRQRWGREDLALGLWLLASLTPPVLFYAIHLYPEMPVAFLAMLIFRRLLANKPINNWEALGLGVLLATFPWFGLKYTFIFWPLLLTSIYKFWRRQGQLKPAFAFALTPLVSQGFFYWFIYHLYGTLSPIAIYEGVMTSERLRAFRDMVLEIPWQLRLETFFDYFLDQRDGLLPYAPFYFFALLGFVELYRRKKKLFWTLLFLSLPFLFNYSFFTHRQGYSPQGRVLTPLIWVGLIALAEFLAVNRKRILGHLFFFTAGLSLFFSFLLITHPTFLYQPTTHEFTARPGDLFVHLSNIYFFLPSFLPSFIKVNNIGYWPNYFWLGLVILSILGYSFDKKHRPGDWNFKPRTILVLTLLAIFLWVLFPRPALYPVKTINYSPQRSLGFYLFFLRKGVVVKDQGDFYLHQAKPYRFIFGSKQRINKLQIILGTEKGDYQVKLKAFDQPLVESRVTRSKQNFDVTLPSAYRRQHLFLYELNLEMKHLSPESMILDPFLIQFIPEKR